MNEFHENDSLSKLLNDLRIIVYGSNESPGLLTLFAALRTTNDSLTSELTSLHQEIRRHRHIIFGSSENISESILVKLAKGSMQFKQLEEDVYDMQKLISTRFEELKTIKSNNILLSITLAAALLSPIASHFLNKFWP